MKKKLIGILCIAAVLTLFLGNIPLRAEAATGSSTAASGAEIVICIDPGHGGTSMGTEHVYDGISVAEKDVNLKLALYLANDLSGYKNVKVVLTRSDDRDIGIKERVNIAVANNADYLISIHNNQATNPADTSVNGMMVLLPVSRYQAPGAKNPDIYGACTNLGTAIAGQLQAIGLKPSTDFHTDQTAGLLRRPMNRANGAKSDLFYPDGSTADYYGLIRNGVNAGIPTIIVEHAYLSNESNYRTYLKTDEALQTVAMADALGIAQALSLSR